MERQAFELSLNNVLLPAGESYGGQYITMLTDRTLERNRQGAKPYINIKGYQIGNAVTA